MTDIWGGGVERGWNGGGTGVPYYLIFDFLGSLISDVLIFFGDLISVFLNQISDFCERVKKGGKYRCF